MYLKTLNFENAKDAYHFFQNNSSYENGFENQYKNWTYNDFVSKGIKERLDSSIGKNLKDGYVPDTYFLFFDDNHQIVGVFKLRHYLNEKLKNGSGHVGYMIDKNHRQKGYAKEGLRQLINLIRSKNLIIEDEIYFECNINNWPSIKTILSCGGSIHHKDDKHIYLRIKK